MNKPEMCCTCKFWTPGNVDKRVGRCNPKPGHSESTEWDDKCHSWEDCDNKTPEKEHILGYD